MKVLAINGSPRSNGNTSLALEEMRKIFDEEGQVWLVQDEGDVLLRLMN